MAINFPSSPSLNQVFNDTNTGNLYIWTGDVWLGYGNALPIQVGGGESYWLSTVAGIHTLSNVGIGTTNPISALTVQGDGRFSGVVTATSFSGTNLNLSGTSTFGSYIALGGGSAFIDYNAFNVVFTIPTGVDDSSDYGGFKFVTTNPGLPPSQETSLSLYSAGSYWDRLVRVHRSLQVDNNITVNGTSTFAGITTVTGNTLFTKQLNVSGIATISGDGTNAYLRYGSSNAYTNFVTTYNVSQVGGVSLISADANGVALSADTTLNAAYWRIRTLPTGAEVNGALNVSGVSTFSGNVSFGSSAFFGDSQKIIFGNDSDLEIFHNGSNRGYIRNYNQILALQSPNEIEFRTPTGFYARFTESFGALLYDNNNQIRLQTLGAGVTITGTTFTNQLSVSGVSTLSSNVSVGGTISVDGGVKLATNNATIVGTSGTAGEIKQIGGAPFYYDGSAWREFVLSSGTPVTVPADTEWDNVVFRATFDTDFTDAKFGATPVRVSSGSTIVGAAVTIGSGAYRNIGGNVTGAGVSYAYRSDYDFTGSWTIEFWIYHDSIPVAYESLVSQVSTADGSGDWTFGVYNNGYNIYWIWDNENATGGTKYLHNISNSTFDSVYLDKWTHYALVREGGNGSIHFYINGVETPSTINNGIIDNDILHINGAGLGFGALFNNAAIPNINGNNWNNGYCIDAIFDDVRISCGVGTAGQRYTSVGIATTATFTPPTTALPTTGTLSSYVQPPGDKYGEITLGGSPTWRGTSGVTVSQQSSGNYRVSFASSYTSANDYYVLSQGMDQGFASYVGIARSTTHVDLSINKQSDDTAVNTGALAVQIKNHI